MTQRHKERAIRAAVFASVVGVWEVLGRWSSLLSFTVGTPSEAAIEFWKLLTEEGLIYHFVITGSEASVGLVLGVFVGSTLGLSFWFSNTAYRALQPLFLVAANVPVFAFAPLLVVWFGVGFSMKVALAFFFTFFATVSQTQRGADTVTGEWVEMYYILGGSRWGAFRRVVVPGALTSVLGSLRASVGLALLGAFIGEFISSSRGLGFLILRASGVFNVPRAIGASFGIVILALLLDRAGAFIERRSAEILQFVGVAKVARGR